MKRKKRQPRKGYRFLLRLNDLTKSTKRIGKLVTCYKDSLKLEICQHIGIYEWGPGMFVWGLANLTITALPYAMYIATLW